MSSTITTEHQRLEHEAARTKNWKRWGPYLSERQWATVREDYSPYGNCWDYFPHDHARSRAYRWGEDGLLGISDRQCRLCFALALWNANDPILKERLFGLTGSEGNHGEDVKELYYYLDSTPTHSYMKALYKYPQAEYPYAHLAEENRRRGLEAPELELMETGVFNEDRYFDVVAEYAKASENGGFLQQADGTAWMGFYCLTMLSMALELAQTNPVYEDMASKFFEHFIGISDAMNSLGGTGLWDEEDGFYYDQLKVDGQMIPLRTRSLVGLMPMIAVENLETAKVNKLPGFKKRMEWFLNYRKDLASLVTYCEVCPFTGNRMLAIPSRDRLRRALRYMLDENEFLSPYGLRSISRVHGEKPYVFRAGNEEYRVDYVPGEGNSYLFGGNSNWRGPIWFPINFLIVEALERYHLFYGDSFKVECPTGSGNMMTLQEVSRELARRLGSIFLPNEKGARPCHGDMARYADDPHWRDLVLVYEYFHGETGRGCGASHQTGWTALAVKLLENTIEHPDQSETIDRDGESQAAKVRGAPSAKRGRGASRPAVAV